ncbi:MAG: nitroreductase family protein, partial [Spirochaetota bacterium]
AVSIRTFVVVLEGWGAPHTAPAGLLKGRRYSPYDVGMAAEHFCLQAAHDGLGTCMLGWFDTRRVRRLVGAPPGLRPALVITVGYPRKASAPAKKRKALSEVVSWNRYGTPNDEATSPPGALSPRADGPGTAT